MAKRGAVDKDDHSRSPHREDPPGRTSPVHKPKAGRTRRAEEPPSPKVPDWPRADCTPEELRQAFIGITTDLLGHINAVNERVDAIQGNGYDDHVAVETMKPKILKLEQDFKRVSEQYAAGRPPQQLKDLADFAAVNVRIEALDQMNKDLDNRSNEMRKSIDDMKRDVGAFGKVVADDADHKERQLKRVTKVEDELQQYVTQLQGDAKDKFAEVDEKFKGAERECEKLQTESMKRQGETAELVKLVKALASARGGCTGYSSAAGSCTGYSSAAGHTAGPPRSLGPDGRSGANTGQSDDGGPAPRDPAHGDAPLSGGGTVGAPVSCHCSDGCKCVETVENNVVLLQVHVGRLDARIEHLEALARRALDTPPSVPATDEWQKPGRCPWSAAGAHRPHGGGDDGRRGPGGGAGPGGDVPPSTGTGGHVGPTSYDIEKLFDDKVALADKYQFGGGDGGERWRVKIRGYWISKFPALQGILNWAENMDDKRITMGIVAERSREHFWMTEASVPRLSELLWGFLNTCLTGEAHTCFEGADVLNGLDAWRLVVNDIQKGRLMRTAQLRKLIRNPPQIAKLEDVDRGITRFENIHREYASVVGDRAPHDDEKRMDLLECLPVEIREQLLCRATAKTEDFADFVNHVRSATNSILYHRGKIASPLNIVNSAGDAKPDTDITEKFQEAEEVICAVLKKMGFQGQRRDGGGLRTDGQRGGARPVKCANCQAEGHVAKDCRKPRVEINKRLCYECGKPGHVARDCRNKGARGGTASVRMVDDEDNFFGCVTREGWQAAGKPRTTTRPTPSVATLGDFVPTKVFNKFDALTHDDAKPLSQKQRKATLAKDILKAGDEAKRDKNAAKRQSRDKNEVIRQRQVMVVNEPNNVVSANALASLPLGRPGYRRATTPDAGVSVDPLASLPLGRPGYHRAPDTSDLEDEIRPVQKGHEFGFGDLDRVVAPCYYEDDGEENGEEILAATEETEADVALDSGAVAHVVGPDDLPGNTPVEQPEDGKLRNFVGANNSRIKNFGKAKVVMTTDDGKDIMNTFNVADVSRPLHAVSVVCDTDKEVLFTKGEAVVVPDGALSRFLGTIKAIAKYPRKGGLYVARMRVKNPRPKPATASGFGRQGTRR